MKRVAKAQNYSSLITDLASLIEQGRKAAVRYVNTALVTTYWLIGRRIVEFEQKGKERAEYGEELLTRLADDLSLRFGKGFSKSNLFMMRAFCLAYSERQIFQTLSGISETQIRKFPLGGLNNKIFASKYKLKLPDLELLKAEIEHERQRLVEMKIVEEPKMDS